MSRRDVRAGRVTRGVLAGLLAVAVLLSIGGWLILRPHAVTASVSDVPPAVPTTNHPAGLSEGLGVYASYVPTPDGSMDVDATVRELKDLHVTRYYYLIWQSSHRGDPSAPISDDRRSLLAWENLPAFAEKAAAVGIDVVVYLVPPLESTASGYRPFGWDYVRWFREIGRVARTRPNIVGIAMDDFGAAGDTRTASTGAPAFTPELVAQMLAAARESAPLRFYAVEYGQDLAGPTASLPAFRSVVDGVVYAYSGRHQLEHAPQNTTDASGVVDTTRFVRRVTACNGETTCWQFRFDRLKQPLPSLQAQAVVSREVQVPSDADSVSLDFTDDRLPGVTDGYAVQLSLDGVSLPATVTDLGGWHRLSAKLPSTRSTDGRITVTVVKPPALSTLTVFMTSVRIGSTQSIAPTATGWTTSAGPATAVSIVRPLSVVLLMYAARFGVEGTQPGPADAPYFARVAQQARNLVASQDIDGLVAYRPNLTGLRPSLLAGDPANSTVLRALFGDLSRRPG